VSRDRNCQFQFQIGKADTVETSIRCRYGGVDEELCSDEVGGQCAFVARVIDAISANGESSSVWFVFLGATSADNVTIGGTGARER
jgi:hypothetical protein